MPSGSGSGICSGPQITLISSSPMIMPPMVIRICLRWLPYTGRTMKRSNARPTAPATSMATTMAGSTAIRLRHRLAERGVVAHAAQHAGGDEGAQRDEHAVAEVQHVHQAEHQRQARGDDEDDHAHRQAGHGQRDPGRTRADEGQHQQRQQRAPAPAASSRSRDVLHIASPSSECCKRLVLGQFLHRAGMHDHAVVHHGHACRPAAWRS